MTETEAQQQLKRVFDAFPGYRGYFTRAEVKDPTATLAAWVAMLMRHDAADVTAVVDQMVAGTHPPRDSEKQSRDLLPLTICERARQLAADRYEVRQMQRLTSTAGAMDAVGRMPLGRIAINLGQLRKTHRISKAENDQRMAELIDWHRAGEKADDRPSWLTDDLIAQRLKTSQERLQIQEAES